MCYSSSKKSDASPQKHSLFGCVMCCCSCRCCCCTFQCLSSYVCYVSVWGALSYSLLSHSSTSVNYFSKFKKVVLVHVMQAIQSVSQGKPKIKKVNVSKKAFCNLLPTTQLIGTWGGRWKISSVNKNNCRHIINFLWWLLKLY